ncbi:nucleotidyltransferase domain-containing protein [Halalkalibacterium halodurans]|uniref:nucleotidyltransferase domain-containing protein n=1 Tax=Halalkalibacterium halodurans TaxID=86665 RepID=UPI002AAA104E|nr:nucleotidyltransferase domain-containing protein [Halalkalibacterium halodurans]MDY7224619.1 nucleotidyltransferase domain-containing protein [Halalkalibacterium halodurans]MDY7240742.1 nucleotidyltransferase domain-containing protein [Halalkalibacterium halodurans]
MVILRAGYGLDSNGFIVSDVSKDKIAKVYVPCICESVERLRDLFHQQLHSVYVYGSVARGEAIALKSDLDLIAMFDGQLSSVQMAELKKLAGELSQAYCSLVREVGIAVTSYDYTVDPSNYYESAFLKELCVCVYGEDVGERFGPYKLTSEIAIRFNGDICESLTRALTRLEAASNEEFKPCTQSFARKLIRTFYSMVMVRSQIWTTRLHEQSEVFIHHFPDKESMVRTLLKWIDEPPTDREIVYELFKSEGEWACANFTYEANRSV